MKIVIAHAIIVVVILAGLAIMGGFIYAMIMDPIIRYSMLAAFVLVGVVMIVAWAGQTVSQYWERQARRKI